MLNEEQITALKNGEAVALGDNTFIVLDEKRIPHIATQSNNVRKITRFELPSDTGLDKFCPSGNEMDMAIDKWWSNDSDKEVVAYRTMGKDESRNNPETCSINVYFSLQPKNGIAPTKGKHIYNEWEYATHRVVYKKSPLIVKDAVKVAKAIQEEQF